MFSSLAGITLSEYIRRRRLTQVACILQQSNTKVIDIAMKYGYESPDAFTRAFRKLHGVTPASVRKNGIQLNLYPQISFKIAIKDNIKLQYRLLTIKKDLRFVGKGESVKTSPRF